MPFLVHHSITRENADFALIAAFGSLSYLEACIVLEEKLTSVAQATDDVVFVKLKDVRGAFETLAGIHKAVVEIATAKDLDGLANDEGLRSFMLQFEDGFNFSVSVYPHGGSSETDYRETCEFILSIVRDAGFRRANLVRPRSGTEVRAVEIASREILDFVIVRPPEGEGGYWLGLTVYVTDSEQYHERSNKRPVVSSEISISSRLARLLLNLSGAKKGQTVLDPFCGSGTILVEALQAGVNCIGVDRDPVRVENARRNLDWLVPRLGERARVSYTLEVGDALRLEEFVRGKEKVDAIVTEPILLPRIEFAPPLDKARKMVRNASRLYSEALYSMSGVLRRGGRLVVVAPSLRTAEQRDVSVLLQDVREAGLKEFRTSAMRIDYPVRVGHESTRWVRRLVYVFERL